MSERLSYNIREAAAGTGYSQRTLLYWHQIGKLPGSRRDGRIVIIPAPTLLKLVNGELDWQREREDHNG